MTCNNYYCASDHCRRTTERLIVRMENRTFFYCVECGRRLELRNGHDHHHHGNGRGHAPNGGVTF